MGSERRFLIDLMEPFRKIGETIEKSELYELSGDDDDRLRHEYEFVEFLQSLSSKLLSPLKISVFCLMHFTKHNLCCILTAPENLIAVDYS